MLGKTVGGRYQIVRNLGGGGFGRTYLAEDWHLPGRPSCVVKQLKPQITDSDSLSTARRLFDREAEVLYALGSHDQIPQLFAHFEDNHEFYLVQELVEGQVLSRELRDGCPIVEEQVAGLLLDVLTTLEFVHQQHVIHRDIKPSNLIRRKRDHKIVLIDFGAVKQINGSPTDSSQPTELDAQSSLTIAIGSAGYMPNEQMAGKPRFSSDIYAVGMVAIRALTGLYPAQLPDDVKTGEICWREKATVTPEFADVLDRMVCYDFRQRYQSATEALEALRELVAPHHGTVVLPLVKAATLDGHLVWIERGDELFHQQRYQEAIACYDKALQSTPDDYMLWFKRGMALDNLHVYDEAIDSYSKVIQLRPDDYLAWFKQGKALEHLQCYEQAIEAYNKVIELQPDNYWAWHDRGRVLEASEQFEEAVNAYDRAVQLKSDFELAINNRKRVLNQLKQVDQLYGLQHYEETIASCDRTIATQPNDALTWLMRGMALEKLRRYDGAIASYDRVVQIQPDDHLAWFKRGTVLEHLKQYKDALLAYNQVVQLQPDNYWAWHDRGRVLEILKRHEAALASYDKAVQLKPDFPAAIEGRQRILNCLKQANSQSPLSWQAAG
ncbi:MAG: tetratricopeptide repeat protein [Leptolyngbyaceae cyanobacterium SL_7_1]|nr:tetratricopeptide repeat protein [Leptolyngbyaceae cyanobacterium SL_7_1]